MEEKYSRKKRFKKETIERFSRYFKKIVTTIIKNPDKKLKDIEMLSEEEKSKIRSNIRNSQKDFDVEFNI